jgi:hypothetical protein
MSKLDFITYLKSTLVSKSSKLKNAQPPNLEAARKLDRIVATAEKISDGYWLRIASLYEPLAPKLQLAIMHLNADIIAGQATPTDFDSYISRLVSDLSA